MHICQLRLKMLDSLLLQGVLHGPRIILASFRQRQVHDSCLGTCSVPTNNSKRLYATYIVLLRAAGLSEGVRALIPEVEVVFFVCRC